MFSSIDFHLFYFTFDWFLERVATVAVGEVGEGLKPCTVDAVIKRKKGISAAAQRVLGTGGGTEGV